MKKKILKLLTTLSAIAVLGVNPVLRPVSAPTEEHIGIIGITTLSADQPSPRPIDIPDKNNH